MALEQALKIPYTKTEGLKLLHLMFHSRFADEKMAKMVRQNKGATFQLSAAGHEMIGVLCAHHLISGKDWGLPYYRDQPFAIGIGSSLFEIFAAFLAKETTHHSGGRMMPGHFSHKDLRLPCQSSVVGSQFLHATGLALGIKLRGFDEVVYVSGGEGSTSQGDFHEALNFSALHALPVIFVIQDNGWAISVSVAEQTAGGSIVPIAQGFPGLCAFEVDGTDPVQISEAMGKAVSMGRSGQGPSVIVAKVPRLSAHSSSDDPSKYKTLEMLQTEKERDPLACFEKWLVEADLATIDDIQQTRMQAFEEVEAAALQAESLPTPRPESATNHVFVEGSLDVKEPLPNFPVEGEKVVIMDALNHALAEEMERDSGVVVFGQDVAHGKGGVFGITRHLTAKFGTSRCFNTPLAESTIIGLAIGLSFNGYHRPVAEIQFADYLWTGINQLFNELSSIHYRSNGQWQCPVVVRMPCGGYIQGGPYHSQSIEGFLSHCPGLIVVIPSNAADAKALLKTAIRSPNPVIFLEHKGLYRQQKFCARPEPTVDDLLPFGVASIVKEGSDVTLVCWGMMVVMGVDVADKLAKEGISIELIDLRTIVPLDEEAILRSVNKTGKLIIVHEAARNCGFGAEIAARVAEKAFTALDAPIVRICGRDCAVPYSKVLEDAVLPQVADIEKAVRDLISY